MAIRRKKHARENDLLRESELYLKGTKQAEIAEIIGISQQSVSADLRCLQKRWQDSALVEIDAHRGKELAKIDELERTFWLRYEASDKTTHLAERWLSGVLKCIDRRCKLIGADRPAGLLVGIATQERQQIEVSYIEDWRAARIEQQTEGLQLEWPDSQIAEEARERSLAALAVAIGNAAGGGVDIIDGEAYELPETSQDATGHAQGHGEALREAQGIPIDLPDPDQESDDAQEIARLEKQLAQIERDTAEVEAQIGKRR